ncbi:flavin reductase family protein [Methylomicrobium sp. RS1]|jgi:flavin reductase (DIM6/NTAB) family NADH-FMN oxidoreductase RutF|uniref:flavin reductase family protein n=1 Tax=Candidatus Methylomicrobium oryzae TaxID=2802053 RepID=UPI0019238F54|nr:flavin reductase family protein [Methylomicrobium sp. RS1]MBL1265310.1 flavin reductase family protein [Methylomicrobium sp. RS1]
MAVTGDEFKKALQQWASGVAVVATHSAKLGNQGMTVTAFASVSMTPPQVLVCINESADTGEGIKESERFSVNVLSSRQQDVSNHFAGGLSQQERFEQAGWTTGIQGVPLLNDSIASLDCRVVEKVHAGTHWIIIGEVENTVCRGGEPLLYFRSQYRGLSEQ